MEKRQIREKQASSPLKAGADSGFGGRKVRKDRGGGAASARRHLTKQNWHLVYRREEYPDLVEKDYYHLPRSKLVTIEWGKEKIMKVPAKKNPRHLGGCQPPHYLWKEEGGQESS